MNTVPEGLAAALADRYRIEREIGAGGMATVYLAEDLKHHRQVAIKVLRPDIAASLGAERFLREVGIAARLSHPHILGLHDSGEAHGFLYYVMPYVEGISLRQKLQREGELPIPEAVRILRDVADAMAYAHEQGVVHRDIKPENVMLTARHALVMDFGVAKALAEGQEGGSSSLTSAGVALGTPAYMAPEQAAGESHVDHRADLYAWGVVAYELLAGQPPFVRATPQNTLAAQVTATPEPVIHHRANVPGTLARLVMQCLEKKPADRPQTAEEVLRQLDLVLTPSAGMTPTDTRPYQTAASRRARRRALLFGTVVVAGLAAIGVLSWRWWQGRGEPIVHDRVVVAPLEAEGDGFEGLARDLAALPTAMTREGIGIPVPAATVRDLAGAPGGDQATRIELLGRRTGAGYVLRTSCRPQDVEVACQLELLQRPGNRLRMAVPVTGVAADSAFSRRLREQVLVMLLLELYWGDQTTWLGEYVTPSLEAVRAAIQSNELEWTNPNAAYDWSLRASEADSNWIQQRLRWLADRAPITNLQKDSTYATLSRRPGLTDRDRSTIDYYNAWKEENPERFFQIAERDYRSWPSYAAVFFVKYAVSTNRLNQALAAAARADSLPASRSRMPYIYWWVIPALHQLGRYQQQLGLAAELRTRYPELLSDAWGRGIILGLEIQGRAGLGDVEGVKRIAAEELGGARQVINLGNDVLGPDTMAPLELIAHGKAGEGEAMLATMLPGIRRRRVEQSDFNAVDEEIILLEWTSQLEDARRLAEDAHTRGLHRVHGYAILGSLGRIAARQGRRAEALAYSRELADSADQARQRQDLFARANFLYYEATVAARLGDQAGAVRLLESARNAADEHQTPAGFTHVHRNPDLASLRGYPPYEALFKPRD